MHIHARTLAVKVSCILTLETEITTDISWDNKASGTSAYKYNAAVLFAQKQYDWEQGPISSMTIKFSLTAEQASCYFDTILM